MGDYFMLVVVGEFLLYVCLSLLIGSFIFYAISSEKMPTIHVPKKMLVLCTALVPLLSFIPVLSIVFILTDSQIGFWAGLTSILFTFEVGKAWLFLFVISALLLVLLLKNDIRSGSVVAKFSLLLTVILIVAYGKASHASTITEWSGFFAHSFHLLAVTVWIGTLMMVGWFARGAIDWKAFLRWYTPLAVVLVFVVILAGYVTMEIDIQDYTNPNASIIDEYKNSLTVNYGQALLMKHLFIIPLLILALMNTVFTRIQLKKDATYQATKWVRAEAIVALIVFSVTAFMGQQYPPHQMEQLLAQMGPSPLFEILYPGIISETMKVLISFSQMSYFLLLAAVIFLALLIVSVLKKLPTILSLFAVVLFVASSYLAVMMGVK